MKQILATASLALLLAACETYPQGDSYPPYPNAPYPPYPADPYPQPGPYPAPAPPYPPAYPPAQFEPGVCEGIVSRDWRAWVDAMPGTDARPTLHLTGTVVAPTAGYRIEFRPQLDEEDDGYPVEVTATLQPFPPTGAAAQVQTIHDLRWQWPLETGPVGTVTIECGDRVMAQVPVARTQ